jgi:adenosine deaminase
MTLQEVVDTVHSALFQAAEKHGIGVALLLCCLRHQSLEQSLAVAQLAAANTDKVCALDLAGDEANYTKTAPHEPAFDLAKKAGLHVTAHAGENAGAASVRAALDRLGAERIGHGVRIDEDSELVGRVAESFITLEMCPRSNVQTRATRSLATHPVDRLLRRAVPVTVSTDARTISATTLTAEFARLTEQFGWGIEEFTRCQHNAARSVFAPENTKEKLLTRLNKGLQEFSAEVAGNGSRRVAQFPEIEE